MPDLAKILKDKFTSGGYSKAYVAAELGVTERTIENYMNGNRQPKPDVLVRLSAMLGFELSELSEQNVPQGTLEQGDRVKLKMKEQSLLAKDLAVDRDQNKTIENLSESNLILARSVERAIGLIASVQSGTLLSPQFAADIQGLIEEIGSGRKQMSMADVQKRLNKVLVLHTSGR